MRSRDNSHNDSPIVAVIPNYNMGAELVRLLPELANQGYDQIYVVDDASTDNSVELIRGVDASVTLIECSENKGAGHTRNQVLGHFKDRTIIHFIDADMQTLPESQKGRPLAELAREAFNRHPGAAFIGGLIVNKKNGWHRWNYGPLDDSGLRGHAKVSLHNAASILPDSAGQKAAGRLYRQDGLLAGYVPSFQEPALAETGWCAEGNLIIDSEVFRSIGGFDSSLREHEIKDLALRLRSKLGRRAYFDPSIALQHLEVNVRGNRLLRQTRAAKISHQIDSDHRS